MGLLLVVNQRFGGELTHLGGTSGVDSTGPVSPPVDALWTSSINSTRAG